MRFALDYDGTADEDIGLFVAFVLLAQSRGHQVVIVTMRFPSEASGMSVELRAVVNAVFCTSRQAKVAYMRDVAKVSIDVWIDDSPTWLLHDAK